MEQLAKTQAVAGARAALDEFRNKATLGEADESFFLFFENCSSNEFRKILRKISEDFIDSC